MSATYTATAAAATVHIAPTYADTPTLCGRPRDDRWIEAAVIASGRKVCRHCARAAERSGASTVPSHTTEEAPSPACTCASELLGLSWHTPGCALYVDPPATEEPAAAPRVGQVPPYTVEEANAVAAAGLSLVATVSGGQRSHEVSEVRDLSRRGRHLGRVSVITETMGDGAWHRFAAYRPDGSRVDYYRTRLDAALALRPEEPGPVSLSETLVPGERRVLRDGVELGVVRRERGREERWEASDAHGILRINTTNSPEDAARLLVEGIDRRAADRAERDAWAERESAANAPDEVLPSGRYGVKTATAFAYTGPEPVVWVVQRLDTGRWGGTPGRWTADTLAGRSAGPLAIDYGAGWVLDEADTAALCAYARQLLNGVPTR